MLVDINKTNRIIFFVTSVRGVFFFIQNINIKVFETKYAYSL